MHRVFDTSLPLRLLCCLISLLFSASSFAKDPKQGPGLGTQLNAPFEEVLKAVRSVTEDGIIQGSWEYKNTKEIDHAQPADGSRAFGKWTGPGSALYKVKTGALAPQNFYDSASQGTVSVRYIVTSAGERRTTVQIDAVFQEDSGHGKHASNGQVEQKELDAITAQLRTFVEEDVDQQEAAARQQQDTKVGDLQAALDHETAQLQAVLAREQELRAQIKSKPRGRLGHIRTSNADLKAEPNNQSKTLQSLAQGDAVTVLRKTAAWEKVQAANGEQGWVYTLMVDGVQ